MGLLGKKGKGEEDVELDVHPEENDLINDEEDQEMEDDDANIGFDEEDDAERERKMEEQEKLDAQRKFKKEMGMIFAYLSFVVIYCIMMWFAHGDQDHYFNLMGMKNELFERDFDYGEGEKRFGEVTNLRDMYLYLKGPLLNVMLNEKYTTSYDEEISVAAGNNVRQKKFEHTPNFYNRLIGGIRLRQQKMQEVPCDYLTPPFVNLADRMVCFDKTVMDKKVKFGKELSPPPAAIVLGNVPTPAGLTMRPTVLPTLQPTVSPTSVDFTENPTQSPTRKPTIDPRSTSSPTLQPFEDAVRDFIAGDDGNGIDPIDEKQYMGAGGKLKWEEHQTAEQTKDFPFVGLAYPYMADGYVADLPLDYDEAVKILNHLEKSHWISAGTRILVVRFWTFNPVLNLVYAATLAFEMPSGGGVIPRADQHAIQLDRYAGPNGKYQSIMEILFVAFLFFFIALEFKEMKHDGIKTYCKDGWNLFDWIMLILLLVTIIIRLLVIFSLDTLPVNDGQTYVEISDLVTLIKGEDYLCSVSLFLLLLKFFKMLGNRFPRVNLFGRLIQAASLDLILLVSLLVLFVFTFAFAGYVAFSSSNFEFRSIADATLTCVRGVFGDLDFDAMYVGFGGQRGFATLFFFLFQSVVLLVMINVFIAVVNESWEMVGAEDEKQTLSSIYSKLLGQKTKVDPEDFFQALLKLDPTVSKPRAAIIFKHLDKDKSGYIDEDEMKDVKQFISHPEDSDGKKALRKGQIAGGIAEIHENSSLQLLLKPQDMQLASLRVLFNHKMNMLLEKLSHSGLINDPGHHIPVPQDLMEDENNRVEVPPPTEPELFAMRARRSQVGLSPGGEEGEKSEWQATLEERLTALSDKLSIIQSSAQNSSQDTVQKLTAMVENIESKVASMPALLSAVKVTGTANGGVATAAGPGKALKAQAGSWIRVKSTGEKYYYALDGRKLPDGPEANEQYLKDKETKRKMESKEVSKKGRSSKGRRRRDYSSYSDTESSLSSSRSSYSSDSYDDRRGSRRY
mmetsp:Transcript_23757/g.33472  ORF Transcript_23757/g.33472 Transcript_23757/m.33472 type:complete len:1014 (-) Transcript_23757:40-3081(-)|eukprot:CAMPEP_0175131078 /NCGR_PEP_ID=MMETSP0087-20121206/6343_1 /TAXON_ID=136419 /ORGANISM="Unknown Unknown, Strain D1" /LENGTH=1013 /DNA_ID=CAMNT_0016413329 /DNA_START=59 /DNA_END=3100 /DNA_ORIENTATION=-